MNGLNPILLLFIVECGFVSYSNEYFTYSLTHIVSCILNGHFMKRHNENKQPVLFDVRKQIYDINGQKIV